MSDTYYSPWSVNSRLHGHDDYSGTILRRGRMVTRVHNFWYRLFYSGATNTAEDFLQGLNKMWKIKFAVQTKTQQAENVHIVPAASYLV